MAWTIPWELVGLTVSGDFGDLSVYTNRFGKKVFYPRAPPEKPPSLLQLQQRQRFRSAVAAYMALTSTEKAAWELITQRASCCLTGQNLFIKIALKRQLRSLDTMRRQTGVSVSNPPAL